MLGKIFRTNQMQELVQLSDPSINPRLSQDYSYPVKVDFTSNNHNDEGLKLIEIKEGMYYDLSPTFEVRGMN